jgi:hypothetical protein
MKRAMMNDEASLDRVMQRARAPIRALITMDSAICRMGAASAEPRTVASEDDEQVNVGSLRLDESACVPAPAFGPGHHCSD